MNSKLSLLSGVPTSRLKYIFCGMGVLFLIWLMIDRDNRGGNTFHVFNKRSIFANYMFLKNYDGYASLIRL